MLYRKERDYNMSKALSVIDIINVFDTRPLSSHEKIDEFYVDTSEARGEDTAAKMMFLLEHSDKEDQKFLFMGHNGCGKSTELYKIADILAPKYLIIHYSISQYVDFIGISYIDVLFSILNNVLLISADYKMNISRDAVLSIYNYWKDEKVISFTDKETAQIEAEASIGFSLFEMLSEKIKFFLQTSSKVKDETTRRIEPTIPELISKINLLLADFTKKAHDLGKTPLLMIDDLDKLGMIQAREIFIDHSRYITSLNLNIVYTFPIYLFYSPDFKLIESDFDECLLLSVIKVRNPLGEKYTKGVETIREIVSKRADSTLFEDDVVDFVIDKSAGSLRTVCRILREAALNAALCCRKDGGNLSAIKVGWVDVKKAYSAYKSEMERLVRKEQIGMLREIHRTKRPFIDKDNVLVMDLLRSLAVIEYNSERWCDLNPAIREFLEEKNEL